MILASNNANKVREIKEILNNYEIKSLNDLNINIDIPETGETFYDNALIKAKAIYEITHEPTIADDSGLIFEELGNWPGVHTKRIESTGNESKRNNMLIEKGKELKNKTIYAICNIVYYDGKDIISSEGRIKGTITDKEYPGNGFGFDHCFKLEDGRIMSNLTKEEKNKLSHRYLALIDLKEKLDKRNRS